MKPRPSVIVDITEIIRTSPKGVRVRIKSTGRPAWLPSRDVEWLPGAVVLPKWLARKVMEHEH